MLLNSNHPVPARRPGAQAFTLVEVVVSVAIAGLAIGGIIYGYANSARSAEWSGYSLAAQALAIQRIEQTRACKWDQKAGIDQLVSASFPMQTNILDLPVVAGNAAVATNFTTILTISANPPLLKMVRVDCVWRFAPTGKLFTNTVATYRGPDN